jgi:hypothetical protein
MLHPYVGVFVGAALAFKGWLAPRGTRVNPVTTIVSVATGVICGWLVVVLGDSNGFQIVQRPRILGAMASNPFLIGTAILLVSILNATYEEWMYRFAILGGLRAASSWGSAALPVSAISFGLAHVAAGIPKGIVGFGLTASYGLLAGMVFLRSSDSRFALVSMHVAADVVILASMGPLAL